MEHETQSWETTLTQTRVRVSHKRIGSWSDMSHSQVITRDSFTSNPIGLSADLNSQSARLSQFTTNKQRTFNNPIMHCGEKHRIWVIHSLPGHIHHNSFKTANKNIIIEYNIICIIMYLSIHVSVFISTFKPLHKKIQIHLKLLAS